MKLYYGWNVFLGLVSASAVLVVVILAGITYNSVSSAQSVQRLCIFGPGIQGALTLDNANEKVSWEIQYTNPAIIAMQVTGPNGFSLALCGVPSTFVCDTSIVGVVKDTITSTYLGNSLTNSINDIRLQPWLYQMPIHGLNYTYTVQLGPNCGIPNQ